MARPYGRILPPAAYARFAVASRLDRRHHPRLHHLVADRTCPSLFHTREQKNGLLESPGSLAEQDGADARPYGAPWFRLRWFRSVLERQPRLRRIPPGNAEASRRGAGRIPRLPRSPAPRQGQGRVRRLHGAAQDAPDPAERSAAKLSTI